MCVYSYLQPGLEIRPYNDDPDIIFSIKDKWIMKLTSKGIKFNRDEFKNLCEDDFANLITEILEKSFTVKIYKKGEKE